MDGSAKETRSPLMVELAEFLPEIDLLQTQTPGGEPPENTETETVPEDLPNEEETTETEEVEETQEEEQQAPMSKEWPESARKRVDKLTAKLRETEELLKQKSDEAEAEVQKLREKLTATDGGAKAPQPETPAGGGPLAEVWSESDLMEKAYGALNWKRWAVENPDGGTLKVGDEEREFSPDDVRQVLINADRLLAVEIPKRREFLQKTQAIESHLRNEFPQMFEEGSEGWKGMMDALATLPELKSRTDGMGLALMLSLGLKEMQRLRTEKGSADAVSGKSKAMAAAGAVDPGKKKLPVAPTPVNPVGGPASPAKKPDNKERAVSDLIATGGDLDALEKYFTGG
jgi:ElaB/YqjD/DUF883 family membrane-anchored ribosome-binding protein